MSSDILRQLPIAGPLAHSERLAPNSSIFAVKALADTKCRSYRIATASPTSARQRRGPNPVFNGKRRATSAIACRPNLLADNSFSSQFCILALQAKEGVGKEMR